MVEKHLSETYLANAARERGLAADTDNGNIKGMHERSAAKWEDLAGRQARLEKGSDHKKRRPPT